MAANTQRILGIDPGLNTTGYGVVQLTVSGPRLVEAGVIRSTAGRSLTQRLAEIHHGVADAIAFVSSRSTWRSKNCTPTTNGLGPRS